MASVRSLMMHRILRKSDGVTVEELSTKLLADVKLVATRLAQLGREAICDSLADLEWLADKAFDLGIECIAALEAASLTLHRALRPLVSLERPRRRGFRPSTMTRCGGPPSS